MGKEYTNKWSIGDEYSVSGNIRDPDMPDICWNPVGESSGKVDLFRHCDFELRDEESELESGDLE
jgi:hypothetical protein